MVKILYFGRLTDGIGTRMETRDLPVSVKTTDQLRQWLDTEYGSTGTLLEDAVRIAINNEIVSEPVPVSNTDEIAFMPPVGGG